MREVHTYCQLNIHRHSTRKAKLKITIVWIHFRRMTTRVTTKGDVIPLAVYSWAGTWMLIREQMKDKHQLEGKFGSCLISRYFQTQINLMLLGKLLMIFLTVAMTEPTLQKTLLWVSQVFLQNSNNYQKQSELSHLKNKLSFCTILIFHPVVNMITKLHVNVSFCSITRKLFQSLCSMLMLSLCTRSAP